MEFFYYILFSLMIGFFLSFSQFYMAHRNSMDLEPVLHDTWQKEKGRFLFILFFWFLSIPYTIYVTHFSSKS